jgi:hypothetical protein
MLSQIASLHAQKGSALETARDPSGHWEGTVSAPSGEVRIEVDLARSAAGDLAGTISQPAQKVKGLPLASVTVDGSAITFEIMARSGGGTFMGDLLGDGKSMSGSFVAQAGTVPFSLTRTGDARIEAPPKSAAIGKEMEGIWNGTLDVEGKQSRIVLKMSNQPDGTSTGSLASLDEEIEVPVAITQKAASLTLDVKAIGSSYSGVLDQARTELVGTYTTQSGVALSLTFRRSAGN